jgi:SOS-response transcriptional repressor LexA
MHISDRVKKRRIKLNLTQFELAELSLTTQQGIQRLESGEVSNPRNIKNLASALQTTEEYLKFGVGDLDNAEMGPPIRKFIPVINYVQAGNWGDINEIKESGAIYSSKLVCPVNCSENTFALRVQGVSMEPKFQSGDLIFVDPLAQVENGSFVIARLDDENQATFKQLIIEGEQKFLKPLNKDWPDQLIAINGNCTIVGKVVFKGEEL